MYFIRPRNKQIDPRILNHSKDVNGMSQATFFLTVQMHMRFIMAKEVGIYPSKMKSILLICEDELQGRPVELR